MVSTLTKVIKISLLLITLVSIGVAIRTYFTNGLEFALAYTLAFSSLILISVGLLFKSEPMQAAVAIAGIILVCVGVWFFPPWAATPNTETASNASIGITTKEAAPPQAASETSPAPAKAG
jgi:hypothetical protein